MLEQRIQQNLKQQPLLLMTHMVLGYPSFEANWQLIEAMDEAGVEMVELQIPFSEPSADGPVILKACSRSLDQGIRVDECLAFAAKATQKFKSIDFLFMTYYNILYNRTEERFVRQAAEAGIKGLIIPDLPMEEADGLLNQCRQQGLDNIFIFTPTNSDERMKKIADKAMGFVYCVGRKGVTGGKTSFTDEVDEQIARYQKATKLPLAMGFGIQSPQDIRFLKGKVQIAVIGSKVITLVEQEGIGAARTFLSGLREAE